jgi:hypothetical protein
MAGKYSIATYHIANRSPPLDSVLISAPRNLRVLGVLYVKACHLLTECFVVQAGRY